MGPRRHRHDIGRMLRARTEEPAEDAEFTRRLAAVAGEGASTSPRPRRVSLVVVAVLAPLLVLGSLGVAYGTGLVHVPWRGDTPARLPDTPSRSATPSEQPGDRASDGPSASASPDPTPTLDTVSPTATGTPTATPSSTPSASVSASPSRSPGPTRTPTATGSPEVSGD